MNDTRQDILNTIMTTVGQLENHLQESGTIVIVRDIDHRLVHANTEFAKLIHTEAEALTGQSGSMSLPDAVDTLFSNREKAVIAEGKPVVSDEVIPFSGHPVRYSTVYFPVKNAANDIAGVGIVGIPVKKETVSPAVRTDTILASSENDLLTGIPDRLSMMARFENEIAHSAKNGDVLTLVLINIDDLARINEEYGQATGDVVLVEFCELVKNHLRSSDLFGRWEDNEFILLLPDTNVVIGSQIAERIRLAIENRQFQIAGAVTASFGVAVYDRGEMLEDCVSRADAAVFVAKMNGKNRVEIDRAGMSELSMPNLKASNFLKLVWKHEYECGNTIIDYQHRMMLSDANRLLSAILDNKPKKQITPLISKLLSHIQQHFDEEESILEKIGYQETEEHALIHRQLIQKAVRLSVRFEQNKLDFSEIFNFLANDVVIEHMIKTDKKYFPFLPEAQK